MQSADARRFCCLLLAILVSLSLASPGIVSAQAGQNVILFPLQMEGYPKVTAFLDAHQANGDFIYGLRSENLRVIENGQIYPVSELKELRTGVQFVIAISLGTALGIRDAQGMSRLDYLVDGLSNWASGANGSGLDDFSLVTQDGPEVIHKTLPALLGAALQDYQPEARRATPSLEVLSRALQVAADPLPRPGMERAVLFITPPQPAEAQAGLQSLAAQASQLGTRLFIWLVASTEEASLSGANLLLNMALQGSGRFFLFTGIENLPDLDGYLEPLRPIYSMTYSSAITSSGEFPVFVEIDLNGQLFTSSTQNLAVQINPPNPIFISPPTEILRSARDVDVQEREPAIQSGEVLLLPEKQPIEILVEFPDGISRTIIRSAFFVDGELVEEKNIPPFNAFNWDLNAYRESGMHLLRVEIQDSLGLTGSSAEIPVRVTVQLPTNVFQRANVQRTLLLVGVIVLVSGSVLGLVLILAGRLQPAIPGRGVKRLSKDEKKPRQEVATRPARNDPLTQPVTGQAEASTRRFPRWTLRLPRAQGRRPSHPLATLTLVSPMDDTVQEAPVPITIDEITFGRDATRATWVIEDASLEPVHARLVCEGENFRLFDELTTAGTWVNYAPVPEEGALLEHGDLIHIGRVNFRIKFRSTERIRKPTIQSQEQHHDSF